MDTAYSEVVDGLVLPRPLGGHPALDLCNSRAGWGDETPKEYLQGYDELVLLARQSGILPTSTARTLRRLARLDRRSAARVLTRALELRDALYEVLLAPRPGPAWDAVAREAEAAASRSELVAGRGGPRWRLRDEPQLDLPLLAFARAGAELLTSPQLAEVARCPGHGCGWLFLDRGGRRRWCTMATCGNRAKVRRHARRARLAASASR